MKLTPGFPFAVRALALTLVAVVASTTFLAAQVPHLTGLAALERKFRTQFTEAREAAGGVPSRDAMEQLVSGQIKELELFLENDAEGDDRFNGRLMLTDLLATIGRLEDAGKALSALDADACPALILLTASSMAESLRLEDLGNRWKAKALEKDAPFEDRMTIGMLLMTMFVDVEGGEKIFADAMAAATDDEARARVAWFRARAIREREDLPEGAYEQTLEELAERWKDTRFGKIARDRIRAMSFTVGGSALPLGAPDMDGDTVELSQYEGKVVLLDFWASWSDPWLRGVDFLRELNAAHEDLVILGVNLDDSRTEAGRVMAAHKIAWRQIHDGRAWEGDLVLRYAVETLPHMVLIGRDGKIAALNLHAANETARAELGEAVRVALAKD